MRDFNRSEAMTGLELIIVIAILCIFLYISGSIVFNAVMPGKSPESPGGLVGFAVDESDEILMTDGTSYGAQNTGGVFLSVELNPKEQSNTDLGSCTIPIKLFIGRQVAVDLSTAEIIFKYNEITETLYYSEKRPLISPCWTIADKSSMIPLSSADEDNVLEPNEIFTVLVYPKTNVPAHEEFSVSITPESVHPFVVKTVVPPEITKHRIVELPI
ncbi:MAG: hypothetical protein JXQ82_02650 [Methanomicrobiaceae archaeon]|nr:hypothetical protein [Methanomicrobiaceae archaeon]